MDNYVLRIKENLLFFRCPGCKTSHTIQHGSDTGPNWTWNGDPVKPTFTPSVLVTYPGPDAGVDGAPPSICHSFVREDQIIYLSDCTHELANQTVDLPPWRLP